MIFVVMGIMTKMQDDGPHARGSCFTFYNARSEAEAKGQFLDVPDVASHIAEGWRIGKIDALQLPPAHVLQDEDLRRHIEKLKE